MSIGPSPGGGFGPVDDQGYGVSYMILKDRLYFHVAAKASNPHTSSKRFAKEIETALEHCAWLLDDVEEESDEESEEESAEGEA